MDLLLSPHNDDCELFCAFTAIRERPYVWVCLKSQMQENRYGILAETRERETACALTELGSIAWGQSTVLDTDPLMEGRLHQDFRLLFARLGPERVWAPAIEEGGHEQHSLVGEVAQQVFGDRVQPYLTYVRGQGRTVGREVPFEPQWVSRKLRALACYESQIALVGNTQPWFMDSTLREYVP